MKLNYKFISFSIFFIFLSQLLFSQKPTEQNFHFRSGYKSINKTKQAVNSLVYRSVISLSYNEVQSSDLYKNSVFTRSFQRGGSSADNRTIDIVVNQHPDGGYEIFLYGKLGNSTNPDLTTIASNADLIFNPKIIDEEIEQAYQVYYCSYISADRAVGMLKGLGYNVVEFNALAVKSSQPQEINERLQIYK
ncbi:MAG: hypothetical protein O3A55_03355, partial [Bacteroidetes bacterium]|nr:hypothetical protein [Bacteroidota bacterium]